MALGGEVFTSPNSKLKAVCINPVDDPDKIQELSDRFYKSLAEALEIQFGDMWATEVFKRMGLKEEDFEKK